MIESKPSHQPAASSARRRSILAVFIGLVVIVLLSLVTNMLVRFLDVLPYGDPAAALIYRSVYMVLGGYISARLAPSNPMQHAVILGGVQFVLFSISAIILIPMQFFGPAWYYLGLIVLTLPCSWFGGILQKKLAV
jgi:hypothetical protein